MGKSLTVGDSNANARIAHPLCGPHVSLHRNQKNHGPDHLVGGFNPSEKY